MSRVQSAQYFIRIVLYTPTASSSLERAIKHDGAPIKTPSAMQRVVTIYIYIYIAAKDDCPCKHIASWSTTGLAVFERQLRG